MPQATRIFVSHAHEDSAWCRTFVERLRAVGADVWYDEHNLGYGALSEVIERELQVRPIFIPVLSPASVTAPWVKRETAAAIHLADREPARIILPVMAVKANVPVLWEEYRRITGPGDTDLTPEEAAGRVASALALVTAPGSELSTAPTAAVPAPAPKDAQPAHHLTPMRLYDLGFRGWSVGGAECVLPPLCPVPGGVFAMGGDRVHDKAAKDDETPQYPVMVAAFAIGQHPVTVAEYACAVRARAVRAPGGRELLRTDVDWQVPLKRLNHPVVAVSWSDAVAYAAWLANLTGQPCRLPTEAEWEKAARCNPTTGASRIYPWGDTFDQGRCNTRESGTGTTTPVGTYPTGASPCGAQDMAGNVLEWTSSLYKPYPYVAGDGREFQSVGRERHAPPTPPETPTLSNLFEFRGLDTVERKEPRVLRVLRGGSWATYSSAARAAYRDRIYADSTVATIGFRLVCAVPNS